MKSRQIQPRTGFLGQAFMDLTFPVLPGSPVSRFLGKEINEKDISAKHANFEHKVSNRISPLGEENK